MSCERDDVEYVTDTFRAFRNNDPDRFTRTTKAILQTYDAMADAIHTSEPYHTVLDPPPGHGPRHAASCSPSGWRGRKLPTMTKPAVTAEWLPAVEDALAEPVGASWHRVALQVNPYNYRGSSQPSNLVPDEPTYSDAIVRACLDAEPKIDLIAITDHWGAAGRGAFVILALVNGPNGLLTVLQGQEVLGPSIRFANAFSWRRYLYGF